MSIADKPVAAIYVVNINDVAIDQLVSFLDNEEFARLERFRQPADKSRHLVAHGLKRIVMSQYVRCTPDELHFSQSSSGKPVCLCPVLHILIYLIVEIGLFSPFR